MGNCQAAEAATVVIQHRDGRLEKAYRSLPATQVMAANPGHYVAIVITTPRPRSSDHRSSPTRYLKLLRPDDALLIGNVYRLVTFEEVLREFASKKQVRLSRLLIKRKEIRSRPRKGSGAEHYDNGGRVAEAENSPAAKSREEHDQVEAQLDTELEEAVRGMMSTGARAAGARHRQWKPALHSIAEVATVSSAAVRYLKLLRLDDTLLVGHFYRLVSFEDVLREFGSKRRVRLSKLLTREEKELGKQCEEENPSSSMVEGEQETIGSGDSRNSVRVARKGQWRPALQTIAEADSFK
ncbi:hypothetical protein MUK42_33031 [Musa troglodytarum]|uniref:Uncharacterized protein n=1 Tax=Musa troglodytarum TaxID=320322 RepID=A0A9E7HUW5_9LILI|nr:hypothetical protein MUK42_33031 [Musa troglodytarum]